MKKACILSIFAAVLIVMTSGMASAQDLDVFWTNYFSNNTALFSPDATVRITNPGLKGGNKGTLANPGPGSLCAMIYVFSADQQLNECCGCLVTPNGLQTSDVKTQLTMNPLTGLQPNNGVIEIMSSAPNSTASTTSVYPNNSQFCDPSVTPIETPDLRAWGTHIQSCTIGGSKHNGEPVNSGCSITETHFEPVPDGHSECPYLVSTCNFVVVQGSGHGICDCGAFEK